MQVQPNLEANRQLANAIISSIGNTKCDLYKDVQEICTSEGFLRKPTVRMVALMIHRGVGRSATKDCAFAYIIGRIPGFIDQVGSPDYLRHFAIRRFNGCDNKDEILKIFEKSLASEEFQLNLKQAVACFHECEKEASDEDLQDFDLPFERAERALRTPLTIFVQAERLKVYTSPSAAREQ